MEKMNSTKSTLVWSLLGTIVSLIGVISSLSILPGLEWRQWRTECVCYVGGGLPPYIPKYSWDLALYSNSIYHRWNEDQPMNLRVFKVVMPIMFMVCLFVFGAIYRRTYRAQFLNDGT
jgi:hypothetical protein